MNATGASPKLTRGRSVSVGLRGATCVAGVLCVIFGLAGCLKVPLGDPEQSRVDDKLVGVWLQRDPSNGAIKLMDAIAYDARTYLVISYDAKPDAVGAFERGDETLFKGWLTEVGGRRFLTLQLLGESTETPYVVARIDLDQDGAALVARGIKPDFVKDAGVETADDLRKLIAGNLDNDAMYLEPDRYFKAEGPDLETVREVIGLFR